MPILPVLYIIISCVKLGLIIFPATELMDFSRTTPSDEIEDEPGNPWDESTTPVGSHFGESGDRIRSARIRGTTATLSRGPADACHDQLPVSGHDDVTDPEVVIDENEGEKDDIIDEKDPSDDDEDAEGW